MSFAATAALLKSDPFNFSEENKKLFRASFVEMATHHFEHNAVFRQFWQKENLHPLMIKSEQDLAKVPAMLVTLFKEFDFYSVPAEQIILTLTSSGTGGQKSVQRLDQLSYDNVIQSAFNIHQSLGMTSSQKVNYLCFTYDPEIAKDLGTAFTDKLLTSFTGRKEVVYAFQWDENLKDFTFDESFVLSTLRRFQRDYDDNRTPVRILGFPAFLYKILNSTPESFHFGLDSWVQTGGGWKSHADQEIPKDEFRYLIERRLGIPREHVRDLFGMVEHGIPYVDCEQGHMHIPNYARVFIKNPDPLTGAGLIHFICSYNRSYPCLSILATDYGKIENCTCSLGGPILKILGRAGLSKHKGCAMKATEMIKP